MKRRKVIQITVQHETSTQYAGIVALCDDGTIWFRNSHEGHAWIELPLPPEEEASEYRGRSAWD